MKISVVALVSLFTIQVVSSSPAKLVAEVEEYDGWFSVSITEQLDKIKDSVDKDVEQLNNNISTLKEWGQAVIEDGRNEIKPMVDDFMSKVKDFKEKASSLNDDVKSCVSEEEEVAKNANEKLAEDIGRCFQSKLVQAEIFIHIKKQNLKDILNDITSIVLELKECDFGDNMIACTGNFISKTARLIAAATSNTLDDAGKVVSYLLNFKRDVTICIDQTVLSARDEHKEIISDIEECFQ